MKTVKQDAIIKVPSEIAVCPTCGGALYVDVDAWCQDYDGSWRAAETGIHTECENEPDIDDDEWDEWFYWHCDMPYVDWLPIDIEVRTWMDANYRFEMTSEVKLWKE